MVYTGSRLTLDLLRSPRKTKEFGKSCSENSDWSFSEAVESEDGISERLIVQLELIGSSQSRLRIRKTWGKGQNWRVSNYIRSHI